MDQAHGQIQIYDVDTEACNDSTSEEEDSFDPQDNSVDTAEMELISQRMGEGKLIPPRPIRSPRVFPVQDTLNETNDETLGTTDSFDMNSNTITESMHERVATERGARARPQRVNRDWKPENGLNGEQSTLDTSSTPTEDTFNSQDNSASQTFLDRINKIKDEAPPRPRPNRHGLPSTAVAVVGLETESEGSQEASFRVDIAEANNDENGQSHGTSVEATPPAFSSELISASDSAGASQESQETSVTPEIAVIDEGAANMLPSSHTLSRQETEGETYSMDDFSEVESDVTLPVSPAAQHSSNDRSSTLSVRSSSVQVHDQNLLNFREETAALGHSLNVRKTNNSTNKSNIQAPLELEVSGTIQTKKGFETARETHPRPQSRSDNSRYSDASSSKRSQPQAQEFNYTSDESEGTVPAEHSTQCLETNVSKHSKKTVNERKKSYPQPQDSGDEDSGLHGSSNRFSQSNSKIRKPQESNDKDFEPAGDKSSIWESHSKNYRDESTISKCGKPPAKHVSADESLVTEDENQSSRSRSSHDGVSRRAENISRTCNFSSLIPSESSDADLMPTSAEAVGRHSEISNSKHSSKSISKIRNSQARDQSESSEADSGSLSKRRSRSKDVTYTSASKSNKSLIPVRAPRLFENRSTLDEPLRGPPHTSNSTFKANKSHSQVPLELSENGSVTEGDRSHKRHSQNSISKQSTTYTDRSNKSQSVIPEESSEEELLVAHQPSEHRSQINGFKFAENSRSKIQIGKSLITHLSSNEVSASDKGLDSDPDKPPRNRLSSVKSLRHSEKSIHRTSNSQSHKDSKSPGKHVSDGESHFTEDSSNRSLSSNVDVSRRAENFSKTCNVGSLIRPDLADAELIPMSAEALGRSSDISNSKHSSQSINKIKNSQARESSESTDEGSGSLSHQLSLLKDVSSSSGSKSNTSLIPVKEPQLSENSSTLDEPLNRPPRISNSFVKANKSHSQVPLELSQNGSVADRPPSRLSQNNISKQAKTFKNRNSISHSVIPEESELSVAQQPSEHRSQSKSLKPAEKSGNKSGKPLIQYVPSDEVPASDQAPDSNSDKPNQLSSIKSLRHSEKSFQRTTKSHSKSPLQLSDNELISDRPPSRLSQNNISKQTKTFDNRTSTPQSVIPEESSEEELSVADDPSRQKSQTVIRLSSVEGLRHSEKSIQRTTKSHPESAVKLSDKESIPDWPLSRLSQNYITTQAKTSDNQTSLPQSVIPEESSEEELFVADDPLGQRSQTTNSKDAEKSRRKIGKLIMPQLLSDEGSASDTPPNRLVSVKGSRQSEKSNHRTTKSQSEIARDSSRNSSVAEELSKRRSQSSTENWVSKASKIPNWEVATNDHVSGFVEPRSSPPSVSINTDLISDKSKTKNRASRTFLAYSEVSSYDRSESDSKESGSLHLRINSILQSLRSSAEMSEEAAVDSEPGEISCMEVIDDVPGEREQNENIQQSSGNSEFSHGSGNSSSNRFSETATLSQFELRGDTLLSSSSNASVPSAALVSQGPTLMQFNILLYEALVRSAGYQDVLVLDDFAKFKDCPVSKPEPKVQMIHETLRRFPYIVLKPADKKNAEQFLFMKQQQQSKSNATLAMEEGSYSQSENENQEEIHPKRRRSRNGKDSRASASKRNTKPPAEIYSQVMDYHKSQINSMSQSQQSQVSQRSIPETRQESLIKAAAEVSAVSVLPPASASGSAEPRALSRSLISDFVDENLQIEETNARAREISRPVTTVIAAFSSIPGVVGVGQKNKVNTSTALIVPAASSTSIPAIPAIASNIQEAPDPCSKNNLSLTVASSADNSEKDTDGDSDFESHSRHRKRLTQVTPKRNSVGILSRTRLSLVSDAEPESEPAEEENGKEQDRRPSPNNIRSLSKSKRNHEDANSKEHDQNEASSETSAVDPELRTAEYNDENIDNYQNQEESSSRGEVDNPPISDQFVDAKAQESDDGRSDDGNYHSNDLSEEDHDQQDRQEEVEAEIGPSNRVSKATSSLPVASNSIVASTLHRSPRSSHPHPSGSRFGHGTPSPSRRLEVASLSRKRNRQSILRESKTPSAVSKTPKSFSRSNSSSKKNNSVNNHQRLSESDEASKSPPPKRSRHDENQNQSNSRRLQNRSESVDQQESTDPDPTLAAAVSLPRSPIGGKGSKINSVSVPTRKSTTEVSRRVLATVPVQVQTSGAGASNIARAKAPVPKKAKKPIVKKDVNYYMSNKNLISKDTVKYCLQELNITMNGQKVNDLHEYLNMKFEKLLDKLMRNAGRPNGMFTYRQLEEALERENLLPKGLGKNSLYIMFAETLCYTDFEKCKGLLIPKDHEYDTHDY